MCNQLSSTKLQYIKNNKTQDQTFGFKIYLDFQHQQYESLLLQM